MRVRCIYDAFPSVNNYLLHSEPAASDRTQEADLLREGALPYTMGRRAVAALECTPRTAMPGSSRAVLVTLNLI